MSRPGYGQPYFPSPSEMLSNPFAVMRRMHEDMDRIFSQAFGGGMMSGGESQEAGSGLMSWSPAIEVRQQGNELVVHAELPGLKPEEVQVEVNEDALIIQGERKQDQSSDQGGVHRTERRYGRFYRAIPLPEGVDADQAKAAFNHGVLEVTVPLPQQQTRRRQIPISGTGSGSSSQDSTRQSGTQQGTSAAQGSTKNT